MALFGLTDPITKPMESWLAKEEIYLTIVLVLIAFFCVYVAFSHLPVLTKAMIAVWLLMP